MEEVGLVIGSTVTIVALYLILTGGKGSQGSGQPAVDVINSIGGVYTSIVKVLTGR